MAGCLLVHGGFTPWSSFGSCSRSCGIGAQVRTRSCTNPRPANGGRGCVGATRNSKSCKVRDCKGISSNKEEFSTYKVRILLILDLPYLSVKKTLLYLELQHVSFMEFEFEFQLFVIFLFIMVRVKYFFGIF